MRIAFVTTEYGEVGRERGGLGNHLARLVPLLVEAGHQCEVILCSGHPDAEAQQHEVGGASIRDLGDPGPTPFDHLDLPGQVHRHLRSAWHIAEQLAVTSADAPFDVIQAPNYGVSGLFVDLPTPLVMRFSSHAPTWHRSSGQADRRKLLGELLQRRAIERADVHFAPSRFVAGLVHEELALDVEVIRPPAPPSIDRGAWDTAWVDSVARGAPYLVHAGQLGRAKGTDLVITAMEALLQEHEEVELHLCGRDAGVGPSIEELGRRFRGRIHQHGRIPPARLHPLMQGAMGLVLAPRADNLPNVAIEAMQLGLPIIGVRGASIDELVTHGENGLLAAPGDATDLAAAAHDLTTMSASDRAEMGARSASHLRHLLDPEATLSSLVALYERAAHLPRRGRTTRTSAAAHTRSDLLALADLWGTPPRRSGLHRRFARLARSGRRPQGRER